MRALPQPSARGPARLNLLGKDAHGFSYLPNLRKDLIYSHTDVETKVVEKETILGGLDIKKKKIYILANVFIWVTDLFG